jgi:predicted RecB family nuclease
MLSRFGSRLEDSQPPVAQRLPRLKAIEKYVGFERKLPESNGAWAMCRYIEATETSDPAGRKEIMSQILAYNEEDLDATWAVLDWVRRLEALTPLP